MVKLFRTCRRLLRLARVILIEERTGRALQTQTERCEWQQMIARKMLAALDITVERTGNFPSDGLIISNHLGYLDVIALASQGHAVFVSKSDVIQWPLIGNLLHNTGTILTYRDQPLKSAQTAKDIDAILRIPLPVVLFPEGTSTNGHTLLPFRSPLFQPAHSAGVKIVPTGIRYTTTTGIPEQDVCYWGAHTFFPHLAKLASLEGVTAHINFGTPEAPRLNRKISAVHFHKQVDELRA